MGNSSSRKYTYHEYYNVIKNDKNFIPFIEKFQTLDPYSTFYNEKHPQYCLLRVSKTVKPMENVFTHLAKNYSTLVKMVYVGSYTKLHHKELENIPSITLSNGKKSENKNGTHIFPKGGTPSFILEWLKNNGGVKKFSHIITLAGDLAARSISFGSADWSKCMKENRLPWHLTSMYSTFAKTTDIPEMLQITGRLCIRSFDGVPLTLYITPKDHENLLKGFMITEEFVNRAKALQNKDVDVDEYVRNLNIFKKKVPSRPLTKSESFKPKKVNTMDLDDGWMADENGYVLKKVKVDRGMMEEDNVPVLKTGEVLYGEKIEENTEKDKETDIEDDENVFTGYIISRPNKDGKNLNDYIKIVEYLKDKKNQWIPLKNIRRIFSENKYNINLHDTSLGYGSSGLIWRQLGGKNSPIEYCYV